MIRIAKIWSTYLLSLAVCVVKCKFNNLKIFRYCKWPKSIILYLFENKRNHTYVQNENKNVDLGFEIFYTEFVNRHKIDMYSPFFLEN